jgi:hypothetical protein
VSPEVVVLGASSAERAGRSRSRRPGYNERPRLAVAVLCGILLVVGCSFPQTRDGAAAPAAASDKAPSLEQRVYLAIVSSSYGAVRIQTRPSAACSLRIEVDRGSFGEGPPQVLSGAAGPDGSLEWSYPAPLIPEGRGRHMIECSNSVGKSEVDANFAVPARKLDPRGFTIRLDPVDPTTVLPRVTNRLDPSLVPARDSIVSRLNASIADEWWRATRGLGALTIVTAAADLVVHVLPGRGTSVHERSSDGTQRVLLYAVDETGPVTAAKSVGVALHELGHTWCCFGPDAGPDEHWLERIADPQLVGVNRFGLMTKPVTCRLNAAAEICASRFSERELRAMGFAEVPAPVVDVCVAQFASLTAQLDSLDAALQTARAAIDSREPILDGLVQQMRSIEAQYASRSISPDARATYRALSGQYDTLYEEVDGLIKTYNADVASRNEIARRQTALPC